MSATRKAYSSSSLARPERKPVLVAWEWDECTDRTASGFARLRKSIVRLGARRITLDMTQCKYLSVAGMRHLLEWHASLARDGISVRVSGLSSVMAKVFILAKLEWIIEDGS